MKRLNLIALIGILVVGAFLIHEIFLATQDGVTFGGITEWVLEVGQKVYRYTIVEPSLIVLGALLVGFTGFCLCVVDLLRTIISRRLSPSEKTRSSHYIFYWGLGLFLFSVAFLVLYEPPCYGYANCGFMAGSPPLTPPPFD